MCMAPMEEYQGIIIKGPNLSTEKDTIKIITGPDNTGRKSST